MLPADDLVEELTRTVFETVVGRTATREGVAAPDPATTPPPRAYAVDVLGAWTGSISIEISEPLAGRLAQSMLDAPEAEPDDVRDAMCELANVIGGNLKGLMPGPSVLSVPRVADCEPVAVNAKQLVFCCEGQPFSVTVRTIVPPKSRKP